MPWLSRTFPGLSPNVLLLACVLELLLPAPCFAQSSTKGSGSIELQATQFQVLRREERNSSQKPFWINRKDCLEDGFYGPDPPSGDKNGDDDPAITRIKMNPRISPVSSNIRFEVWVSQGSDCTDTQQRSTTGNCWKVLSANPTVSVRDYFIYPRDILAGKGGNPADPNLCNKEVEWPTVLYLLLSQGDTLLASTTWDQTQVDTKAPLPPTAVTGSGGDERIFVEWAVENTNVAADAAGFGLYCVPDGQLVTNGGTGMAGAAGASGAGAATGIGGGSSTGASSSTGAVSGSGASSSTGSSSSTGAVSGTGATFSSGTSGSGGGGGSTTSCVANGITAGDFPDPTQYCGLSPGLTTPRANTTNPDEDPAFQVNITNGTTYAVGVASTDRVGNVGRLSTLICATPEPVIGFFENYKNAGGKGGRGSCGLSGAPVRDRAWILALLGGVLGLGVARGRRRRSW